MSDMEYQDSFLDALAEAVKAVSDYMNGGQNMLYISVMNRLSVDCDCMALPSAPDMSFTYPTNGIAERRARAGARGKDRAGLPQLPAGDDR